MSAAGRIAGLHRGAACWTASGDAALVELGVDLAQWLATRDGRTLEQALGIAAEQGRRSARTIAGIDGRNAWLRRGAAECGVDAVELADALARFFAITWQRESHLAECPARNLGRLEFFLWNAMKCWPVPVKARRLGSIIGNERRVLIAEKPCDPVHGEGRNDDVPTDQRLKRRGTSS